MAELERSAVVTEWIRVRILVGSHVQYGFLVMLVAWASVLFASSEGYMCDWHGPAKSPMSAFFFPSWLRKQTDGSGPCSASPFVGCIRKYIASSIHVSNDTYFPPQKLIFYPLFFMKMAESGNFVLASCIYDFDDMQVWLSQFSLNLNAWKFVTILFEFLKHHEGLKHHDGHESW